MQPRYTVRLSLRMYGLVVSILLQSCNNVPISHSPQIKKGDVVKKKDLDEKGRTSNGLIEKGNKENRCKNSVVTCSYQEEIEKKKEQPSVAIRSKNVNQSNKGKEKDKQVQVGVSGASNRRFAKRRIQQETDAIFKESTPSIKLSNPEEAALENKQENGRTKDSDLDKEGSEVKIKPKRVCRRAKRRVIKEKYEVAKLAEKVDTDLVEASVLSELERLPVEILQGVYSYLTFEEMLPTRGVNHFFHALTTGYNQVGVIGITNKPDSHKLVDSWFVKRFVSFKNYKKFKDGIWNHETVPSFIFYQFMKNVFRLPYVYWSCLPYTHIRSLTLNTGEIISSQAAELGEYLVGSRVEEIEFYITQLGDAEIAAITKNLSKTKIEIINFHCNHIGPQGAKILFKRLQGRKIKKVDLSNNRIGSEGLKQIGRYMPHIQLESLSIISNKIGSEEIKDFFKNLGKETGLKEIYLGGNELTEEEWYSLKAQYPHIKFT